MLAGGAFIVPAPQLPELGDKLREGGGYGCQVVAVVFSPHDLVGVILRK